SEDNADTNEGDCNNALTVLRTLADCDGQTALDAYLIEYDAASAGVFLFKHKTAHDVASCLVGSEMCIIDRYLF
ncbi:hypothetical protein PR242_03460, partial [Metamycoplasma hyosynoviae]|uniref:hypothetical protein n=1 Tax=Metamycoplasma hyosynoviae TaxID=29559 RepID=UPI0023586EAA